MKIWLRGMAFLALTLSVASIAETTEEATAAGETTTEVAAPSSNLIGVVELRPTMELNQEKAVTENWAELGYQITEDTSASFVAQFNTTLNRGQSDSGRDIYADDFYVRAKFNNLWVSADGNSALHYQPRIYFPTEGGQRDAGLVGITRQYFSLSNRITDNYTFTVSVIPMYHLYSRDSSDGEANKDFEGRIYLINDFTLTENLTLSVPVYYHQTHYRGAVASGPTNAGAWRGTLYTWPELYYNINSNFKVGAAWRSAGSLGIDRIGDNFTKSQFQAILQARL